MKRNVVGDKEGTQAVNVGLDIGGADGEKVKRGVIETRCGVWFSVRQKKVEEVSGKVRLWSVVGHFWGVSHECVDGGCVCVEIWGASQGREGVSHRFAHFVRVGGELTSLVIERDGGGVSVVENVVDCLSYAFVRNEGVLEFLVRLCLFL